MNSELILQMIVQFSILLNNQSFERLILNSFSFPLNLKKFEFILIELEQNFKFSNNVHSSEPTRLLSFHKSCHNSFLAPALFSSSFCSSIISVSPGYIEMTGSSYYTLRFILVN